MKMNSSRFARTGRIRCIYNIICLLSLVLLVLFLAVFQSTQNQLDETRENNLHLQQQIEELNKRLQVSIEEKVNLKQNIENERQERMDLDQKFKNFEDARAKDQTECHDTNRKYDEQIKLIEETNAKEQKECHDAQHSLEQKLRNMQETSAKDMKACHESLHNLTDELKKLQIPQKPVEHVSEETETQLKEQPRQDEKSDAAKSSSTKGLNEKGSELKKTSTTTTTTTTAPKANLKQVAANSTSTKPTSKNEAMKLPANVAPIPANIDDVLDDNAKIRTKKNNDNDGMANGQDVDSGAHEIKDHDQNNNLNDDDFNLAEHGGNFFEDADKSAGKDKAKTNDEDGALGAGAAIGADTGAIGAGDLDGNNLNNEIAGDQGKEFPDGLHLDEGMEEEEDEDDYSNPVARQQGAQAIRI